MADGGAVDLHEGDAEPVGDILHECCLAVAGRGDEEEHPHAVGPGGVAGGAELLGEVVADEGEEDLVEELVAHERRHDAGLELVEAHVVALGLDDLGPEGVVGAVAGDGGASSKRRSFSRKEGREKGTDLPLVSGCLMTGIGFLRGLGWGGLIESD